jgi:NodT family efflux transporter outer membrane factor (OMF) lipoprotein
MSTPIGLGNGSPRGWKDIARLATVVALAIFLSGCTSMHDYFHNGFKVGPNYHPSGAPVAQQWIDAADPRVQTRSQDLAKWWAVFNDPILNDLMDCAYHQNLTLKAAGLRILEARSQLLITQGNLFPQTQQANASYTRYGATTTLINPGVAPTAGPAVFFDKWNYNFNLQWELDFWGQFRRAVTSQAATLESSVFAYDEALLTMFGDIAKNYIEIRTDQERIKALRENVKYQKDMADLTRVRREHGYRLVTDIDVDQTQAIQESTEAQIPSVEADMRQAVTALCILMGMPPVDLLQRIGTADLPTVPVEMAVGIPAELLCRRPDVRQAERNAAAQAEQIGIAEAQLYPAIYINGTLGYAAPQFPQLFMPGSLSASVGPSFQWNVLNYGRIVNNVHMQDQKLQELITTYQATVLQANADVENGLVTFLKAQEQVRKLDACVRHYKGAVQGAKDQMAGGAGTMTGSAYSALSYYTIAVPLAQEEDLLAQAKGQISQGMILVYRALGGGWEYGRQPQAAPVMPQAVPPPAASPSPIRGLPPLVAPQPS